MSPEAQRIAIAKACGWTKAQIDGLETEFRGGKIRMGKPMPDYLNDLNAMHEAEEGLHSDYTRNSKYEIELRSIVYKTKHSGCGIHFATLNATAAQRAEAFLRTLGLWKE